MRRYHQQRAGRLDLERARSLQNPRTAASKMHQMGTQRGAALGGRCWKQKARCRPAGWIDCGPMASVLEKLQLRNRPPGRKQLTGGPSAARWRAHGRLGQTGGAQEHQLAAARPVHFCCRWSVRLFQPVSLPLPLPVACVSSFRLAFAVCQSQSITIPSLITHCSCPPQRLLLCTTAATLTPPLHHYTTSLQSPPLASPPVL